jgi:hypothetical protein
MGIGMAIGRANKYDGKGVEKRKEINFERN